MTRFPPRFFLRPGERALVTAGIARAWALERILVLLTTAIVVWGGLALLAVLNEARGLPTWLALLATAAALHLAIGLAYIWRRTVTTEYVVTDEFVYVRRGRLLLQLGAAALDRVTDLHVHQGIVGRIFGYAGLRVLTAGGGLHMPGLRDATAVRGSVQTARQALLSRLLREAGREAPSTGHGRPCRCPNCRHVFNVAGPLPLDVQCPSCRAAGTLFEEVAA